MNHEPIALLWSGGKDSALALHALRESGAYDVRLLLTTVTEHYERISMHGVRRVLLEQQAQSLGVPLAIALIPPRCTNDDYERRFGEVLSDCRERGMRKIATGDLFLEDVRAYREELLARHGMTALFPLWDCNTTQVAHDFIAKGFEAVLSCVDICALDKAFAGRAFDSQLLRDLPAGVDPCGENGEFHTFVWDGPGFSRAISWERGEVVLRDERFAFCDFLPAK